MTREDAVERLNALKQFIGYDKDSEIVKATQKSLDLAIKALEHPEKNVIAVVPCGDAISRQAVLDLMMQKWGENFSGDSAMQESIDAIRVLPSVTPQLSSGLEKNSKKLEKEATKNDLGVDCIDRQATLDAIIKRLGIKNETYLLQAERAIYQQILAMPSVTPQEPRCKDCKWWKDSDGVYRRGVGSESICHINHREVYEGNGYCFMFEPRKVR